MFSADLRPPRVNQCVLLQQRMHSLYSSTDSFGCTCIMCHRRYMLHWHVLSKRMSGHLTYYCLLLHCLVVQKLVCKHSLCRLAKQHDHNLHCALQLI